MSEQLESKFLNTEGVINTLKIDVDNNLYTVEDNTGNTFAKYFDGNWDSVDNLFTNEILENKDLYNSNVKFLFNGDINDDVKIKMKDTFKNIKDEDNTPPPEPLTAADLGGDSVNFPSDPEGYTNFRYPIKQSDLQNYDYFRITCYKYEPGLFSGDDNNMFKIDDIDKRVKTALGHIDLPMQPGISESNSVDWGENEINPLQLAGAGLAGAAISGISDAITGTDSGTGAEFFNQVGATGRAAVASVDGRLIKSFFAGQAVGANILGRGTGLAINNNVEVLFNGPNLRTFNYNYRFTPREDDEADAIKNIIRFFKKSMAPKRSNNRIFLKSPDVWKLKYKFKGGQNHPFLNNIKICALTNCTVNYTPDGSYSTYESGGKGDGSMTSYDMQLGFKEITPIYNDDFWNDNEGKQGTGF